MKQSFAFDLKGQDWWKLWAMYWVPTLLLMVISFLAPLPKEGTAGLGSFLAVTIAIGFLQVLVQAWFQIPILGTQLPRLSVGGKAFSFRGDSLEFTRINAVGFFLSVATLGIYLPWYTRRILAYLASQTTFDGQQPEFLGEGLTLLGRTLGCLALSMAAVFAVILGVALLFVGPLKGLSAQVPTLFMTLVTLVMVFVIVGSLLYVIYRWMVHFRWSNLVLRWKTTFWRSFGFLTGQFLLVAVTLGIYAPAACLRVYRYFAARTVVEKDGVAVVRFSFEGKIGNGFVLIWGQLLLTVLSAGFYWPWALERLGPWFAQGTQAEDLALAEDPVSLPLA